MPNLLERVLRIVGQSGLPGKHRVVYTLAPRRQRPHSFIAPFFGLSYAGDLSDWIDRHIWYFGAYVPWELAFLQRCAQVLASRGRTVRFFDVGANVGQHALFMSLCVNQVFAFEPAQSALRRLKANIVRNALTNVQVFEVALAEADAQAALGSGLDGNSGSRSLTWTIPGRETEIVEVRRADRFFAAQSLPPVDILKLDVEGYERKVLIGLGEQLHRDRPIILMELIGTADKSGFSCESELRSVLYPDHALFALEHRGREFRLTPFDWSKDSAVVIPAEHKRLFDDVTAR
jgi:FkbM family methyltransferase